MGCMDRRHSNGFIFRMVVALMPQDTPILIIGWILIAMWCGLSYAQSTSAYDNELTIKTVSASNSLNLSATQIGYNNKIDFSLAGSSNAFNLYQKGAKNTISYTDTWGSGYSWGGDLYGSDNSVTVKQYTDISKTISDNFFGFHISGSNNTVLVGQEWYINTSGVFNASPGNGWGDHYFRLDIHGDYNNVTHTQRTDAASDGQTSYVNVYADYNDVFVQQRQAQHSLNLTINNDYNDVEIHQQGQYANTATITLGGSYGTDLFLQQGTHSNSSSLTYSLTQDCQTVGGCSVSVTQGN